MTTDDDAPRTRLCICCQRRTLGAELAPVEDADIHTGLWCATCAKPSAVSLDTAVYVAGTTTKLRNIHLHYCTDCGVDLTGDAS